jgi:hypothetical protein
LCTDTDCVYPVETSARPQQLVTDAYGQGAWTLSSYDDGYTPEQKQRLSNIHARVVEARRELDALIGDAYLRPRASIVPVHFLDLASAVEKLRWAEKEWRELDQEVAETPPNERDLADFIMDQRVGSSLR